MAESKKKKHLESCLKLPAKLDVSSVASLYDDLEQTLKASEICLDLSTISQITSAPIQLLLSFANEITKTSKHLTLLNPSAYFQQEIANIGLEKEFFNNPNIQVENGQESSNSR